MVDLISFTLFSEKVETLHLYHCSSNLHYETLLRFFYKVVFTVLPYLSIESLEQ